MGHSRWKNRILLLGWAIILLMPGNTRGQTLEIGGKWETTMMTQLEEESPGVLGESALFIDISKKIGDLRFVTRVKTATDMAEDPGVQWEIDEIYMDHFGKDFDIRFGKQRVSWGTALGFSPTDVVNSTDIANPMGDKLANWILKGQYYSGPFLELTGVYIPFFSPSVASLAIGQNPPIKAIPPEDGDGQWAMKVAAKGVKGMDVSVMYLSGWERIPSPRMGPGGLEGYYRATRIMGADFATTLGDVGLWAEAAHHGPMAGEGYTNWIVGGDYGFANGLKLMGQYFHQNNAGGGRDYLMLGLEGQWAAIHNWKIGSIYDVKGGDYLFNPEITFSLADGADLCLGWNHIKWGPADPPVKNLMSGLDSRLYLGLALSF